MDISEEERKTLEKIVKAGYKPSDIDEFIKGLQNKKSNTTEDLFINKKKVRIGIFSDTHFGNINYDQKLFKFYTKETNRMKVDFHMCVGDIFDGWYQTRPSSIFEQNHIGFDRQFDFAVEELSNLGAPLYFITGNHSYNTFLKGAGIEVGPYLEKYLKSAIFLGNGEGNVNIDGARIRLIHPDGGTSYALSYKPQKIIESLESGQKPNLLLIGHFHKMSYMFYRNVHCIMAGTMMNQTKYMKGHSISAHKGFWIIDLHSLNGDIRPLILRNYPAYR